jgi:hypothetical protein
VAEQFAISRTSGASAIFDLIQKQAKDPLARKYLLFAADSCSLTHVTDALSLVKRHWLTILGLAHHLGSHANEATFVCRVEKRGINLYCLRDGKKDGTWS